MPVRVQRTVRVPPSAPSPPPSATDAAKEKSPLTPEALGPPLVVQLPVPYVHQEQTEWCWAACAQMMAAYFGDPAARQCFSANWLYGQSACCWVPQNPACNAPCPIDLVSVVLFHWGMQSQYHDGPVPFGVLQAELGAGRPVEVGYVYPGGSGHVAVVVGWGGDLEGPVVMVNDPWVGPGEVSYASLRKAYGSGEWRFTWTGIGR
ncbi:MAG TPA: papain-like cysteine protease family protein [Longimicrobium sp.]|nr:papain-like cysteine protease family protein [Longimicrobium sp.]